MAQVNLYGVGINNLGKVIINHKMEMDDNIARKLFGPEKNRMVKKIISQFYPDVKISPNDIGLEVTYPMKLEIPSHDVARSYSRINH